MAVRHPRGETVTIHPFTSDGRDAYGNPVEGFGDDIERPNCAIAPDSEVQEDGHGRQKIVSHITVYDAFDAPVGPHDEVTIRGERYVVDGEVERWADPFRGNRPGCAYRVKKVEG